MMQITPNCLEAYDLLHDGILTFADIEENGICIDTDYYINTKRELKTEIKKLKKEVEKSEIGIKWKKIFQKKFNIDSYDQLAKILFEHMGYEPKILTKSGKSSASQAAIEQLNIPIVQNLIRIKQLEKAKNTYVSNFIKESVDNILHPFFNLHTVQTIRSSSNNINFQNIPVRIPYIKKLVRSGIKPRPGNLIAEIDYSGAEVKGAYCYHQDPNMYKDLTNPDRDMHRDMAMECFKLEIDEMNDGSKRAKDIRYCGKNMFVFPQFYGDYYKSCATALWEAIGTLKLETKKGDSLKKHLKQAGISNYNKFEKHVKNVEDYFWNERYPDYAQWKEDHWEKYQENGFVTSFTGFVFSGVMKKNEVINYPIQGTAFHWLLWSCIKLNAWMKRTEKRSKIIGQIHDSIVLDLVPEEINIIFAKAKKIMTQTIREHWKWITIPLDVEMELSPKDGSWYLKKEVHKTDECNCGNKWLYKNKTENAVIWECPRCSKVKEIQNG